MLGNANRLIAAKAAATGVLQAPEKDWPAQQKNCDAAEKVCQAAVAANPAYATVSPKLGQTIYKGGLQTAGGRAYYDDKMKDATLPSGVNGIGRFKGKLVSITRAARPRDLAARERRLERRDGRCDAETGGAAGR
ncbi:MAG: hypothetical protein ACREH9_05655 [Pseudomonadota bacterium]